MKKAVFILAALAAVLSTAAAFAADGVINMEAVMANHPKFMQARQQMESLARQKETEIRAEKDRNKQQQLAGEAQQQLAKEERKLMEPIVKDIQNAVEKVAKSKKLDMVHAMSTVIYGGVDITKDVISALK